MDINLLGAVHVRSGESDIDLGQPRQRLAFAALALDAGRPLRPDVLIDRLWGQSPPRRARDCLYVHIARLRTNLGSVPGLALHRHSGGYVLDIDPLHVDVHRFDALIARARQRHGQSAQPAALLTDSLALWRDEPLADLTGAWVDRVRQSLCAKRLEAIQLWAEVQLELGDPASVIVPLSQLQATQPLAESLVGLLMQALAATGRTAEALELFTEIRARLADELGADPSPELQRIHLAVLRGERQRVAAVSPDPAVPAQLPMDIRTFLGREPELERLNKIADLTHGRLVVVTGTAGVGKTALALRWAHSNVGRFDGGQLYLNLRGFDPSVEPMTPVEALARLLRGLGMAPGAAPCDVDEASALYRSLLAGKRMLVLLDNVHDVRQVRPLLPGAAEAMVLVTSRHRLDGLLAMHDAQVLTLEPLSPAHALTLLAKMLGAKRVDADTRAGELARRCAYLPLALRIAAANLTRRPAQTIGDYLRRMSSPDALDALRTDDDDLVAVNAAFDVSYTRLSPLARRLFRLSCLCGGNDFDTRTAAALCGVPVVNASRAVEELCAAHLLNHDRYGRYSMHDLLRAYGHRRLSSDETPAALAAAKRRLVESLTPAEPPYKARV